MQGSARNYSPQQLQLAEHRHTLSPALAHSLTEHSSNSPVRLADKQDKLTGEQLLVGDERLGGDAQEVRVAAADLELAVDVRQTQVARQALPLELSQRVVLHK